MSFSWIDLEDYGQTALRCKLNDPVHNPALGTIIVSVRDLIASSGMWRSAYSALWNFARSLTYLFSVLYGAF
jgi:hypothetical protein